MAIGWLLSIIFVGCIGWMLWEAKQPAVHDPQAEKAAQELKAKRNAARLQRELQYEEEFWKTDTGPTVLGRIITPNGGVITGRLQFIPECPIGYLCAQPDGTVEDEDGNDITSPPEPDPPTFP